MAVAVWRQLKKKNVELIIRQAKNASRQGEKGDIDWLTKCTYHQYQNLNTFTLAANWRWLVQKKEKKSLAFNGTVIWEILQNVEYIPVSSSTSADAAV